VAERCLVLLKGEHQYVFRVAVGREDRFLEALRLLAANDRLNFDWEDVAFFDRLVADLTGNGQRSAAGIPRSTGDDDVDG